MTTPVGLLAALHERYEVVREVGRGGMATVFLAHDRRLDREVAIKVLYTEFAAALSADRFRREVQFATQLSHPHILPIHDFGESEGSLYYVMPYVRGESLRARMTRERQLPIDDALRIVVQVAGALEHAHQRGVVHRDIKPENILLEEGDAVVADFGIARAIGVSAGTDTLTRTGMTLGTPYYMSPEQALADKTIDGRSDQYALACVLYEMLIGEAPFQGPNAQAIMARHSLAAVPSLRVVRDYIPQHVEDAIMRAMAKVPADRFASMAHFAEAVQGLRTTTTRAVSVPRAPRTPVTRRVLFAAPVLLVAATLAAWVFGAYPPRAGAAGDLGPDARQIAVPYFEVGSADSTLFPIADGLTEALIARLQSVDRLAVVSRNGVRPFRGTDVPRDSLARALRVGTLVLGEVVPERDRLRVSVQLVDAMSGDAYDRTSFVVARDSVLAVQDSLAEGVERFLRHGIGDELRLRERKAGASDPRAWVLVQRAERLRSLGARSSGSEGAEERARRYDEADTLLANAERLDPRWAEPAALRAALALRRALDELAPGNAARWIEMGLAHADRALAIDPRSADALEARGSLRYQSTRTGLISSPREVERLVALAESDLDAAVDVEPTRASAWNALSVLQYGKLNVAQSYFAAQQAYDADAFLTAAPDILWRLFATSYDLEQFVDADRWCAEGRRRFASDARYTMCGLLMLTSKARQPVIADAWRLKEELHELTPASGWAFRSRVADMLVAATIARSGDADSARAVVGRARGNRDVDPRGELMGYEAFVHTLLGEREEAISLLQRYLTANPEHRAGFGKVNGWWWRDLEGDVRFRNLAGITK
jgi:serine/threonine-protein kinase